MSDTARTVEQLDENALVESEEARLRHQAAVTERQRFDAKVLWDNA